MRTGAPGLHRKRHNLPPVGGVPRPQPRVGSQGAARGLHRGVIPSHWYISVWSAVVGAVHRALNLSLLLRYWVICVCSGGMVHVVDLYCRNLKTQSGAADVYRIMAVLGRYLRSLPQLVKRQGSTLMDRSRSMSSMDSAPEPEPEPVPTRPVSPPAATTASSKPLALADEDVIAAEGYAVLKTIQESSKSDPRVYLSVAHA